MCSTFESDKILVVCNRASQTLQLKNLVKAHFKMSAPMVGITLILKSCILHNHTQHGGNLYRYLIYNSHLE